jgi:hypothetical protein
METVTTEDLARLFELKYSGNSQLFPYFIGILYFGNNSIYFIFNEFCTRFKAPEYLFIRIETLQMPQRAIRL